MDPDEILVSPDRLSSLRPEEVIRDIEKMLKDGVIQLPTRAKDALPIFALGFVGGALGAKLLKGTVGIAIGAGVGYWAYTQLTSTKPVVVQTKQQPLGSYVEWWG